MNKMAAPNPVPGSSADFNLARSVRMRDALMGRIK